MLRFYFARSVGLVGELQGLTRAVGLWSCFVGASAGGAKEEAGDWRLVLRQTNKMQIR